MNFLEVLCERERLVFRLDDVVEVLPMLALSGVSQSRGRFRGLLNLRGQVIRVHELSRTPEQLNHERYIVVCRLGEAAGGEVVGLIVDDVLAVADLPLREHVVAGHTVAVAQRDQDLLTVVDPHAALAEGVA